jgi:hypothetical protein
MHRQRRPYGQARTSEILEILLEVALNVIGCVLEILVDGWFGDVDWPDTKASRIILCLILILLGAIIFWELR